LLLLQLLQLLRLGTGASRTGPGEFTLTHLELIFKITLKTTFICYFFDFKASSERALEIEILFSTKNSRQNQEPVRSAIFL
jgi:hypothetical protein